MKVYRISTFVTLTLACTLALCESSYSAVVLDQIGEVNAYVFAAPPGPSPSQIFTDFPSYDCMVLEDFTVSTTELTLTQVSALFRAQGGFGSFQAVQGYSLNIFSAANLAATSLSGDVASLMMVAGSGAAVTRIVDGGGGGEYGLVSLDVTIALPSAGTYWVGMSPMSTLAATGQFFLMNSGATGVVTPGNANGKLANPGLGLGSGALSSPNLNYAYSVTAVPEPAAVMLWIIGGFGWLSRRRRSR